MSPPLEPSFNCRISALEDHLSWQKAYAGTVAREWAARGLVGSLGVGVLVAALMLQHEWSRRYERMFEPVAGLSYEPPAMDGGMPVMTISQALTFQKLDGQTAYEFNASVPVSTGPLSPSRPFVVALSTPDGARALECLTLAVHYEAGSESMDGQRAVAQVVLNRVRHPAFPNSVCGVVFSGSTRRTGCQFTFTCDGALARAPSPGAKARARAIAQAALSGQVYAGVGQATHYHTLWVAPYWSPTLDKVANIGAHTFYRWRGWTGSPGAFTSPYAVSEPAVSMSVRPAEPDETSVEVLADVSPVQVTSAEAVALPPAVPAVQALSSTREIETTQRAPEAPGLPQTQASPAPSAVEPERRRRRVAAPEW